MKNTSNTKVLRIDTTKAQITQDVLSPDVNLYGGRDITSCYIAKEVSTMTSPLSENSKLIIAPGYLTQFSFPCAGRLSIGAKSPLTRGIKESNVGGTMSYALSALGLSAIIIEGSPPNGELYILYLSREEAKLCEANNLRGKNNHELLEILKKSYGDTISVLSIGIAGESLLHAATIACTDTAGLITRHAGRGGLGAVMGAKGIKAIVANVERLQKTDICVNNETLDNIKDIKNVINNHYVTDTFRLYGTNGHADIINALGAYPTRCFSEGSYDMIENVNGDYLRKHILSRGGKTGHRACSLCNIGCSNTVNDKNGMYLTSALEYETICAFGANCGIHDMDTIAYANKICNEIGVDTIETGVAIAVAMRKAGVLGDVEVLIEYLTEIKQQTETGKMLCSGVQTVCDVLDENRIPVVKGQAIPMYDPRSPFMKAIKATYVTSPMGADHTAGYVTINADNAEENAERLSIDAQIYAAAMDAYGICMLAIPIIANNAMDKFIDTMSIITGKPYSIDDLTYLGKKILLVENNYNKLCGIEEISKMPIFMHNEKLPPYFNKL